MKIINVMRALSGSSWGALRETQVLIYRAMVRSRLDYGCLSYGSAAVTHLNRLDVVQAKALRVCSGALRSSPIPALLVELGETPLAIRRIKLAMQYLVKLKAYMGDVPVKRILENTWEWESRRVCEPFVLKVNKEMEQLGLGEIGVAPNLLWPGIPPWKLPTLDIDMSVLRQIKEQEDPQYSRLVEQALGRNWPGYVQIYTDGSKDLATGKAGCSFYSPQHDALSYKRLPKEVSVYTAEMIAIISALQWAEANNLEQVVICSDSAAVLTSLESGGGNARTDLCFELLAIIVRIEQAGGEVGFLWVPAHVGVTGNETADMAAKWALKKPMEFRVVPGVLEWRSRIKQHTTAEWQKMWDKDRRGRHFYTISPSVQGETLYTGKNRRVEVLFTRLRLGHCGLAGHLAKIGKHPDGLCAHCKQDQTVKHVFMECPLYAEKRRELFKSVAPKTRSVELKTLLSPSHGQDNVVQAVLDFISSTNLNIWV